MAKRIAKPASSVSVNPLEDPRPGPQSTLDIIVAIAKLDAREQAALCSWMTATACPHLGIVKRNGKTNIDFGTGHTVPVDINDEQVQAIKRLVPFMEQLQSQLRLCPYTQIRQQQDAERAQAAEETAEHAQAQCEALASWLKVEHHKKLQKVKRPLSDESYLRGMALLALVNKHGKLSKLCIMEVIHTYPDWKAVRQYHTNCKDDKKLETLRNRLKSMLRTIRANT
jgi:hypothetical protein